MSASGEAVKTAAGTFVADSSAVTEGERFHTTIEGRYITLVRLKGSLSCIDSICFHAGGPLGIGDIEDLGGRSVILCPWHYYKIDVFTGEKYFQAVKFEAGKMVAGEWKSNGVKQRVHKVTEVDGKIYVDLQLAGGVASDEYACNTACGTRVLTALPKGAAREGHSVGGDGRKPSGYIMQLAREQKARPASASNLSAPQQPRVLPASDNGTSPGSQGASSAAASPASTGAPSQISPPLAHHAPSVQQSSAVASIALPPTAAVKAPPAAGSPTARGVGEGSEHHCWDGLVRCLK